MSLRTTLKVITKEANGFESRLRSNANIKKLKDLQFEETPTHKFPNGHFKFKAIVNDQLLNSYFKKFEPDLFERRRKGDLSINQFKNK